VVRGVLGFYLLSFESSVVKELMPLVLCTFRFFTKHAAWQYIKNDYAYVEQKNYTHVRQFHRYTHSDLGKWQESYDIWQRYKKKFDNFCKS
jgi:hypothetical protein